MIEDEFFSDDSESGDSTGSFTDRDRDLDYESKDFGSIYENKQVETLKFLRLTLRENKILKRRLHIVENELERYQDFKTLLPAIDDRPASDDSDKIDDKFLITTDDKECQVELITSDAERIGSGETKTPVSKTPEAKQSQMIVITESSMVKSVESFTQITDMTEANEKEDDSELEIYQIPEVLKLDKACQCEVEPQKETSHTESDMTEVMDSLKLENEELEEEKNNLKLETENLHQKIRELKVNNKNLMEKYDTVMSSHEITNGLLSEAKSQLMVMKENNDQLEEYKSRYGLLQAENDELNKENVHIQIKLKDKIDELEKMNATITVLSENFEIMEQQRQKIDFLEAECEKHANEKHIECEKKINDLTQECQNHAGFIEAQKNELKTLNSKVVDLNQQMEKNKVELQSFNFKEFIQLKRELAQLKQEREKQFAVSMAKKQQQKEAAAIQAPTQPLPLPPIKDLNQKQPHFKFFH